MAVAVAAVVLLLLVLGVRGRRRRHQRVVDHAAGIALAGKPWEGPTRMNARPATRHPAAAAVVEPRRRRRG